MHAVTTPTSLPLDPLSLSLFFFLLSESTQKVGILRKIHIPPAECGPSQEGRSAPGFPPDASV